MPATVTVCFFPWLSISEPVSFNGFRLIPYPEGEGQPFSDEEKSAIEWATQAFQCGSVAPKVRRATLLALSGKGPLEVPSGKQRSNCFAFAELLAFSALADRMFFFPLGYFNKSAFQLVIQEVKCPPSGQGCTYLVRRRDGFKDALDFRRLWIKPPHVESPLAFPGSFDRGFLNAILSSNRTLAPDEWEAIWDAISSFNLANTDSPDVPEHVQVVLLLGAIQRLLGCRDAGKRKLTQTFEKILPVEQEIPAAGVERLARLIGKDEQEMPLRKVWLRHFYEVRGDLAHGKRRSVKKNGWNIYDHLLLATFILPYLLKLKLQASGLYSLSEDDLINCHAFEPLAAVEHMVDHEQEGQVVEDHEFPWNDIISEVHFRHSLTVIQEDF